MSASTPAPRVAAFFHAPSNTFSYVVADAATRRAAVVDPALDFDAATGAVDTVSADAIVDCMRTALRANLQAGRGVF